MNGLCLGGGFEMIINADLVLSSSDATFGLPEVKRGVIAIAGALPRLVRVVGRQRAGEMALLGGTKSARDMEAWGVVNGVVEPGADVVEEAVRWAKVMAGNSPDAVLATKKGIELAWEGGGVESGSTALEEGREWRELLAGDNVKEGLEAFREKRAAKWGDSKL